MLAQTYPSVEILVVDDSSTDDSVAIIQEYLDKYPQIKFISTGQNVGNTKAFNIGWRASRGAYLLDFATDDVLLPERVAQQVAAFEQLDKSYGVVFSDAAYISDASAHLGYHYQRHQDGTVAAEVPSGDVFKDILRRYFICPPTMMMRREVFEDLGGYDEALAYEDFDFWVRSSRKYKYFYLNRVTTLRRVHERSLSQGLYKVGNKLLSSTVKVCEKAARLVLTEEERQALAVRLKYEARHAYLTCNYQEAEQLFSLLQKQGKLPFLYQLLRQLNRQNINLSFLRKWYHHLRK